MNSRAVLGAAAGTAAGSAFDYWKDSGKRKAYSTGYVKGRSDEVKRLYWVMKRLHEGEDGGGGLNRGYYELPVPEHAARDGVVIEARTQVVEVIEPRDRVTNLTEASTTMRIGLWRFSASPMRNSLGGIRRGKRRNAGGAFAGLFESEPDGLGAQSFSDGHARDGGGADHDQPAD